MKKIFISILLCLIFCSKGFADSFYFKDCKLSSAVSGDYIINIKKKTIYSKKKLLLKILDSNQIQKN